MVERRKPLVLSSTKHLINSLLSSSPSNDPAPTNATLFRHHDSSSTFFHLPAGILRFSNHPNHHPQFPSLDDSALIGLSTSLLKRLSITSGSLVISTLHRLLNYLQFRYPFMESLLFCVKSVDFWGKFRILLGSGEEC